MNPLYPLIAKYTPDMVYVPFEDAVPLFNQAGFKSIPVKGLPYHRFLVTINDNRREYVMSNTDMFASFALTNDFILVHWDAVQPEPGLIKNITFQPAVGAFNSKGAQPQVSEILFSHYKLKAKEVPVAADDQLVILPVPGIWLDVNEFDAKPKAMIKDQARTEALNFIAHCVTSGILRVEDIEDVIGIAI